MYKIFEITATTFAENCVHTLKVNKTDKSVLWIKMIDIQKSKMLKTFMTWLMEKLKANLRLIIQQMNKLKTMKNMNQN